MCQVLCIDNPFLNEVAGHSSLYLHTQQVFYLSCKDGYGDTAGETYDDRVGNVLDDGAQMQQSESDEEHTRHQRGNSQSLHTIFVDDASHNHDEGTCRAANLYFATTQR